MYVILFPSNQVASLGHFYNAFPFQTQKRGSLLYTVYVQKKNCLEPLPVSQSAVGIVQTLIVKY